MRSLFGGLGRGHLGADLLSAFLDRQTTQDERTRIETHLQTCAGCRAELESLRRTVALLHALPRVSVPRAFTLSEAQAGIRRPVANPGWYGGLLRGLGAVAALALVAFLAVSLLQEPSWTPQETIARAPTVTQATLAPTAPVAGSAPVTEAAAEAGPTEAPDAPAPSVAAPQVEQLPVPEALPSPAASLAAAPPAPTEENARRAADATTTEPEAPLAAMAAKAAETPEDSARATGRGGGGPSTSDLPAEALTPEPTAPAIPLAEALPKGVRMVYADLQTLYAIDPDAGIRELLVVDGINMPQLSPDQQWIVYRTFGNEPLRLWSIPWEGGQPRLLLDDGNLPKERLPEGYTERHFNDSRWLPGGHILAVTLVGTGGPEAPELTPITELWHVDMEKGELEFITTLDRSYRPFYSQDGKQFATLQYGTEIDPQGTLTIYRLGNGRRAVDGRVALTFEASPGKPYYDSQVVWTKDQQLLVAIPHADPQFQNPVQLNGASLYRVTRESAAKLIGTVDGFQVAWSPSGQQMVFGRYTSDTMETVELSVAMIDGSDPQVYATTHMGGFMGWSPDGSHFLYIDNYQVYAGAPGRPPTRLANSASLWDPRWLDGRQFLSLHDQGEQGWWLTSRSVDGGTAGLLALPRETMMDVVSPNAR
jgi:hypothetical protein